MIKLVLKFSGEMPQDIPIADGERLNEAITRATDGIPLGKYKVDEVFQVVVNGHLIEVEFWPTIALKESDTVIISPKIRSGDAGQIFKTVVVIVATAIVAIYAPEFLGAFWGAVAAGATTVGVTLLMNALIPPPVPNSGDVSFSAGSMESSQMYSISGQSNQMQRYNTVPKVYGQFRMYPTIAALPYTELAVSKGTKAQYLQQNLLFSAKNIGSDGNKIIIIYVSGGTAGAETVVVSGTASNAQGTLISGTVTVTFEGGVSTATQVATAISNNATAALLVTVAVTGDPTDAQITADQFNLFGGTEAGETIQYLYAIYDFGLGTNVVNGLKIGDSPLSTNSFQDFHINFVDPAMVTPADTWDQGLKTGFQYYRGNRKQTSLSIALDAINDESIQNSDPNTDNHNQEIILDFVCPAGLYSFSSGGTLGKRYVFLEVEFAPVGTTSWHAYNDLAYVDSHEVVGGSDVSNSVNATFVPTILNKSTTPSGSDTWYSFGIDYHDFNFWYSGVVDSYIKPGIKKLLLTPGVYLVGSKVFYGNRLLGIIASTDTVTHAPNIEVTLDRVITQYERDVKAYEWSSGADGGFNFYCGVRIDSSASATAIIAGKSTSPVYGSVRFTPKNPGQYQVRVRRAAAVGDYTSQTGDQMTWGAMTTTLDSPPISTEFRHTFMELKIRATDQLNGNISTLSGICTSVLPIYDPNTATWTRNPTSNPAWIFTDLLTGEANKKAVSVDRLDLDSIVEWADFCDEVPTPPPAQTYTHPRYQANFILDYQTTLQDLIGQLGGSAQASLNIINGKYGVLLDKLRSTPVQIFTPRNSNSFSSTRIYGPRPDGLKISFIDPDADWNQAEIIAYDNGFNPVNAVNFESLVSWGVTNSEQAWRFGRYMIAQNALRQEQISINVDFEFLACTRGDYVQITQDVMEVGGVPCRVKSIVGSHIVTDDSLDIDGTLTYGYVSRLADGTIVTSTLTATAPNEFDLNGTLPAEGDLIVIGVVGQIVFDCIVRGIVPNDDTSASISLVEKADAIYEYESTNAIPDYSPNISITSLPDIRPPKAITGLVVKNNTWSCSTTKQGIDYYIDLTWDIPLGSVYELFEIWVNDGTGYHSVATKKIPAYRYFVDSTRLGIEHGFKVVAVSATGKKLELIAMTEVFATPGTKDSLPPDVPSLNLSITNQVLQLTWDSSEDCSVLRWVLRYSPGLNDVWESSIPLADVAANVNAVAVQARTGSYFIKALDTEGNLSQNAAIAVTTIPNLFDLNDIDTLNDAPTFTGELVQTELLGEAVILQEQIPGDVDTVQFYTSGFYNFASDFDLGDVYSVRLASLIQADGLKKGELMSEWVELEDVDHLNTSLHSDWDIDVQYRATNVFAAMSSWDQLAHIDHINSGAGEGFTDWRSIPTIGDATGRIFQFRAELLSLTKNVTPRLFDTTITATMPDRLESFENETSSASLVTALVYDPPFAGPGTTPNVQVSIDAAQTGDYWSFDYKTLDGVGIRIYDKNNVQVSRQFDLVAKGFGREHTNAI